MPSKPIKIAVLKKKVSSSAVKIIVAYNNIIIGPIGQVASIFLLYILTIKFILIIH